VGIVRRFRGGLRADRAARRLAAEGTVSPLPPPPPLHSHAFASARWAPRVDLLRSDRGCGAPVRRLRRRAGAPVAPVAQVVASLPGAWRGSPGCRTSPMLS
jgi:hypothetical protein